MLRNLPIGRRLVITMMVTITLLTFSMQFMSASNMQSALAEAERRELMEIHEGVMAQLTAQGRMARAMSQLVAGIPEVQQAFAAGDRARLQALFAPGFEILKKHYGVRQFQFHSPPARSFLRVHKLEKFGDDLSSFRHTVVQTNQDKQPIDGLESGVAGLGIRGIVPVSYQGKHVGSVEFGMSFGQSFFDQYAATHAVDLELRLQRASGLEVFGGTFDSASLVTPDSSRDALRGTPHVTLTKRGDTPLAVYQQAVEDFSGKTIGLLAIARDRSFYASQLNELIYTNLLLAIIGLITAAVLVSLIARSVTTSILSTVLTLEDISAGGADLSRRLDEQGNDEVARLARAFNGFVDTLQSIVSGLSHASVSLSGASSALADGADNTFRSMQKQQTETTQIAAAMTEMSATVQEVARSTAEAAEAAGTADQHAAHGRQVVDNAIQEIRRLADDVRTAVQLVERVTDDSNRIGGVLDVIGGIAEQTNLLALNAAIEAARAGEQGRGFAVVADEVRTLASRTQTATSEIKEMIDSLQSGVKETTQVMEASASLAEQTVQQASDAGQSLADISASAQTIDQMSIQIATASEEQSQVAEEISRNVVNISNLSEETLHYSESTSNQATDLAANVEELLTHINRLGSGGNDDDLERAKASHLAWKTKVRRFLDGKGVIDKRAAFSEHHCGLGIWMDEIGLKRYSHIPEMEQIQRPHAQLHSLIKQIAALKERGALAEAEAEYKKIGPLSEQIVDLISKIQRNL